jgi:hypothetical protein
MPKHEFGIMQKDPIKGRRYVVYEPKRYNCISVDDKLIISLSEKLKEIKCYWHTLDRLESGLAYTGITLIPPRACTSIIYMLQDNPELSELKSLLHEAERTNKYVIHFGI